MTAKAIKFKIFQFICHTNLRNILNSNFFYIEILFMILRNRFFYEDGAAENAGGADENVTVTPPVENLNKESTLFELPAEVSAQLKELEELKAWKVANYKPEKSAEEIEKENELEKVNLKKFAVENGIAKDEDFVKYDTLQQRKDADLVFESFLADFKEDNPDITDEKELEEAARDEFETGYKLKSTNEKAKEKGLAKLAKEANEIRNPFKEKVEKAKSEYIQEKEIRAKMPDFTKFITERIAKNTPDKVPFKVKAGEEEVSVDIELTKEDKEIISKTFNTPKTFMKYSKSPEDAGKDLDKKIQGWIRENKAEQIGAKFLEIGEGRGVAKGSNTGADAPFAMKQQNNRQQAKVFSLEESNNKIGEARARFN